MRSRTGTLGLTYSLYVGRCLAGLLAGDLADQQRLVRQLQRLVGEEVVPLPLDVRIRIGGEEEDAVGVLPVGSVDVGSFDGEMGLGRVLSHRDHLVVGRQVRVERLGQPLGRVEPHHDAVVEEVDVPVLALGVPPLGPPLQRDSGVAGRERRRRDCLGHASCDVFRVLHVLLRLFADLLVLAGAAHEGQRHGA